LHGRSARDYPLVRTASKYLESAERGCYSPPVKAPNPDPVLSPGPAGEVFLSYHSPDRAALLKIRELLATRGIGTFLDRDNLLAGMPWPQALERALGQARAVAVFLGAHGVGLWQKREIGYALDRQVSAERDGGEAFPVIPRPGSCSSTPGSTCARTSATPT
jgi:hypothetical protein